MAPQEGRDPGWADLGQGHPLSVKRKYSLQVLGTQLGKMFPPPPRMPEFGDLFRAWLGQYLVIRGAQEIVTSGVEAEACHSALMGTNNLYARGVRNRPNPDSSIRGGRKHQLLKGKQRGKLSETEKMDHNHLAKGDWGRPQPCQAWNLPSTQQHLSGPKGKHYQDGKLNSIWPSGGGPAI